MQITGKLYNARIVDRFDNQVLSGDCYGDVHGRFSDGERITTSYLVMVDGNVAHTRNSVYEFYEGPFPG